MDQDILSLKEQLKRLNKQLVTKKLESIRPLYPNDIPATKELENMKFDEVQDLAAIVNAFSPIEILQIGSEFMFGVPSADESPIKKKKVTMDINQQIKGIRAIANQHKILLDE